jgi:hypothetical protein
MDSDLAALRRFIRPREAVERCDLCSVQLGDGHPHLVEPATRQIRCTCITCAILFSDQGDGRYKRVPRTIKYLPALELSDVQWAGLQLPIELAFFFESTPDERLVALYPSPAGAMESTLSLESWNEIIDENPVLGDLRPDIEALLVNRVRGRREYFVAPVDECYKLVGIIRSKWHGLSGGTETWEAIDGFFDDLKERADHWNEVLNA